MDHYPYSMTPAQRVEVQLADVIEAGAATRPWRAPTPVSPHTVNVFPVFPSATGTGPHPSALSAVASQAPALAGPSSAGYTSAAEEEKFTEWRWTSWPSPPPPRRGVDASLSRQGQGHAASARAALQADLARRACGFPDFRPDERVGPASSRPMSRFIVPEADAEQFTPDETFPRSRVSFLGYVRERPEEADRLLALAFLEGEATLSHRLQHTVVSSPYSTDSSGSDSSGFSGQYDDARVLPNVVSPVPVKVRYVKSLNVLANMGFQNGDVASGSSEHFAFYPAGYRGAVLPFLIHHVARLAAAPAVYQRAPSAVRGRGAAPTPARDAYSSDVYAFGLPQLPGAGPQFVWPYAPDGTVSANDYGYSSAPPGLYPHPPVQARYNSPYHHRAYDLPIAGPYVTQARYLWAETNGNNVGLSPLTPLRVYDLPSAAPSSYPSPRVQHEQPHPFFFWPSPAPAFPHQGLFGPPTAPAQLRYSSDALLDADYTGNFAPFADDDYGFGSASSYVLADGYAAHSAQVQPPSPIYEPCACESCWYATNTEAVVDAVQWLVDDRDDEGQGEEPEKEPEQEEVAQPIADIIDTAELEPDLEWHEDAPLVRVPQGVLPISPGVVRITRPGRTPVTAFRVDFASAVGGFMVGKFGLEGVAMAIAARGGGVESPEDRVLDAYCKANGKGALRMKIIWPGYEGMPWSCHIPVVDRNGKVVDRGALAYAVAREYERWFEDNEHHSSTRAGWNISATGPGWTLEHLRLVALRTVDGMNWNAEVSVAVKDMKHPERLPFECTGLQRIGKL